MNHTEIVQFAAAIFIVTLSLVATYLERRVIILGRERDSAVKSFQETSSKLSASESIIKHKCGLLDEEMKLHEKAVRERSDALQQFHDERRRVEDGVRHLGIEQARTKEARSEIDRLSQCLLQQQNANLDLVKKLGDSERLAQFRDIFPDGSTEPPAWTVEDDKQICKMLRTTEVGIKLMQGLVILANQAERQATTCAPAHREHACGQAAGWRACIGYLQLLSGKALPQQEPNDEQPQGDEDVSKLYAP